MDLNEKIEGGVGLESDVNERVHVDVNEVINGFFDSDGGQMSLESMEPINDPAERYPERQEDVRGIESKERQELAPSASQEVANEFLELLYQDYEKDTYESNGKVQQINTPGGHLRGDAQHSLRAVEMLLQRIREQSQ